MEYILLSCNNFFFFLVFGFNEKIKQTMERVYGEKGCE